ncbi:MAG: NAD+ synthase [Bdellovibrionota bacterium]
MKIALAQINTTVGALHENAGKILDFAERARKAGAALAVFPELTITGYPPLDLLHMPHFVASQEKTLTEIASKISGITAVVGYAEPNPNADGKGLFNTAAILKDGKVISRHRKRLLPTYDVFDESRYFEPGSQYETESLGGRKAALTVCEDIWNDKGFWHRRLYKNDPVEQLGDFNLLLNISGSPFHLGKVPLRLEMLKSLAKKRKAWTIYVNLVGGNDALIFDGHSAVAAPDGTIRALAKGFEEDLLVFDLENPPPAVVEPKISRAEEAYRALVLGLRDYVHKCGFSKAIIGLSGGIDSALVATLAADALGPENVRGLSMPSPYSSQGSMDDAYALADNLGIRIDKVEITPMYEAFRKQLAPVLRERKPGEIATTEENIQARCRGILLMGLSNETGALVLSTGNKSETAVGYTTLYGDMCGGLAAIGDVPKVLVYDIAQWINREKIRIPLPTIEKPPSAELRPGQKDEDSLPPYSVLDPILEAYVEENKSIPEIVKMGYDEAIVRRIVRMVDLNEYKRRQAAPILRITHRAFGAGRLMPIAQRYRQG